jgi:NAD(P)H-quinone oxidoreductase subunit 6
MSIFSVSESNKSLILLVLEIGIFAGGLGVVALRKIVYSALLLGFVFICVSLLYLVLNADFLAATQVLIYVGAVNVLILFGIMLINKPDPKTLKQWTLGNTISLVVSLLLFLILIINIYTVSWESIISVTPKTVSETNVNIIGNHILTDMLLPFELLSILLLVALVGAITIAKKDYLLENNLSSEIKKNN